MKLPDIKFSCTNTKEGTSIVRIDFSDKVNPDVPWLELTFDRNLPYLVVSAFNKFDMSKIMKSTNKDE